MKKKRIQSVAIMRVYIDGTIKNISRNNNIVDFSKEQLIINKLERKLGKSKNEIKNMISDGLMSILTKVPFSKS